MMPRAASTNSRPEATAICAACEAAMAAFAKSRRSWRKRFVVRERD